MIPFSGAFELKLMEMSDDERKAYLERWYDDLQNLVGEDTDLAGKYGKSGINMMNVFATTGEAPIDENEIKNALSVVFSGGGAVNVTYLCTLNSIPILVT